MREQRRKEIHLSSSQLLFALQAKFPVSKSKFQGKLTADETFGRVLEIRRERLSNSSICILIIKAFSFYINSVSSTALQT